MTIISAGGAVVGAGEVGAYQIERSLRFNSADSAYLSRTPASASNRKTWTWSGWVKIPVPGTFIPIFHAYHGSNERGMILLESDGTLSFRAGDTGIDTLKTTQVFRDPASWYHIVCALDTTQATASNRKKIYVNGVQVTSFGTSVYPTQNFDGPVNLNQPHEINSLDGSSNFGNLYLTEIHFIDGQALDETSFGEYNNDTGVWGPIAYTGTYGTNGFFLNFSDNSTIDALGTDFSGNGNTWDDNGFSVTVGAGNDSLVDTPTLFGTDTGIGGEVRGNYATLNPLILIPRGTISNGNLNYLSGSTASHGSAAASFTLPTTGKWYWEVTACNNSGGSGNNEIIGVANIQNNPQLPSAGNEIGSGSRGDFGYRSDGNKYNNGSQGAYGATYTSSDVISVAWDSDSATMVFYKNGVSQGTAFSSITQAEGKFAPASSNAESSNGDTYNFGQRAFEYTAPSGFKALVTTNLPDPTVIEGDEYFNTVLYTGTGASNARTGVGFQPDWVWIKERSGAADHGLYDAVRGVQNQLESNTTTAETAEATGLTAFGADGFTVGALAQLNTSGDTYVAWNWKANGAGVSNTAGTISSTVSANTDSGFSIVKFTGTDAVGTVGHGLGAVPKFMILKGMQREDWWGVYHVSLGNTKYLQLNTTAAEATSSTLWNDTTPTSTVFTLADQSAINPNGELSIAYVFAEVPGFSAFGSYTGNGNADGPFVFTGFRPAWVMVKVTNTTNGWMIMDNARAPSNPNELRLQPSSSAAEGGANSAFHCDLLSNGFKWRTIDPQFNGSGSTYIFMAFAENPFKFALAR